MENSINIKPATINDYKTNTPANSDGTNPSPNPPQTNLPPNAKTSLRDEFVKEKKKSSLIEKAYNYCKNKTGIGTGSKKIEQSITDFENGKTTEEEVKNKVSNYKISQENAAQNLGDVASASVGLLAFFKLNNLAKEYKARYEVKARPDLGKKLNRTIENLVSSNTKTKVLLLPAIAFLSGITKLTVMGFNHIGSKKFEIENPKQLDKKELKKAKKARSRERIKSVFKNFTTGALNGLIAPIAGLAGGIVGVPAYLAGTFGLRYLKSKNDGKEKSFDNFKENFKNNAVVNSLAALAIGAPAFMHARYSKVLSENLSKVVKSLKGVKLELPKLESQKTAFEEIKSTLLDSSKIKAILDNNSIDMDAKINQLTEENIFAVKFLQTDDHSHLITAALKENCPPSRTMEEAQKEINQRLSSTKYSVTKLLGVGTIAESYLAKDQSGKEVCIKILKKGIDAQKIQKDKEAFIKLVTDDSSKDSLAKAYLIKNIENLAAGVAQEVDFEHEAKSAEKLRKYTKEADVVVPIEAKPGVYVMEKAPGISVDTLVKYSENQWHLNQLKKRPDNESTRNKIADCTKKLEKLKAKSPDFQDFDLSSKDINTLLKKYVDVMVEQFTKVDRNGKTLHADIHEGNIFINLEALKSGKGKLFTLIDTGNTIDLTKEQSIDAIKLTSYIKNGNVKDLSKCALEDAILPPGMTKEKAHELLEEDLKTVFFDKKTKINSMNADSFFALTNNLLRKNGIVPNDTQLNLNKAKNSADNSLKGILNSFFDKKYEDFDVYNSSKAETAALLARAGKDYALHLADKGLANTVQETKNLLQMSSKEAMNYLKNPNMLKTNSEEHLTYKFKQDMKIEDTKDSDYLDIDE